MDGIDTERFNEWLDALLDKHGRRINPTLCRTLRELLRIESRLRNTGPARFINYNGIKEWYDTMMQVSGYLKDNRGTFAFTVSDAHEIMEDVSAGGETIEHCEHIAAFMVKYIERDLLPRA